MKLSKREREIQSHLFSSTILQRRLNFMDKKRNTVFSNHPLRFLEGILFFSSSNCTKFSGAVNSVTYLNTLKKKKNGEKW